MTITNRNLNAGDRLIATHKKATYAAEVLSPDPLKIEIVEAYRIDLVGATFSSLSKAAMAITGNSVNGWRFWTVVGAPAAAEEEPAGQDLEDRAAKMAEDFEAIEAVADAIESALERKPRGRRKATDATLRDQAARKPRAKRPSKGDYFSALPDGRIKCAGCLDAYAPEEFERDETGDKIVACPRGHRADALGDAPTEVTE